MLVEKAYANYTDFRIPGIVSTHKKTLIRYYECRRALSDWADIDIKICRSENGGKTWEEVLVISSGGNTLNNPVAFVDGEQIVFLYCVNYKEIYKRVSFDDGLTFTNAERVHFESSANFFYNAVAIGPGHGTVHNGTLIVPIWFANNHENEKSHSPSFISTLYSKDHGETWQLGDIIFKNDLINPSECAMAVTNNGEFLLSIRHEGELKKRALAKSNTGYSNWYDLHFESNLPDPVCMGSMTYFGDLIFHSNCDSETGRINLTIKVSSDCFKTYKTLFHLESGGYSDIALLENKLYIFYEKIALLGEIKSYELHFDSIDL